MEPLTNPFFRKGFFSIKRVECQTLRKNPYFSECTILFFLESPGACRSMPPHHSWPSRQCQYESQFTDNNDPAQLLCNQGHTLTYARSGRRVCAHACPFQCMCTNSLRAERKRGKRFSPLCWFVLCVQMHPCVHWIYRTGDLYGDVCAWAHWYGWRGVISSVICARRLPTNLPSPSHPIIPPLPPKPL